MELVVRPAGPDDGHSIDALCESARREARTKKGGPALVDRDAGAVGEGWLALLGGVPVGLAVLDVDGTVASLRVLFTDPDARGIGVGHALLDAVRSAAAARGCTRLDSVALPGDRDTKNFFEAHDMVARALIVSSQL